MPRAAAMPVARQDPSRGRNAPRRRARILVVDDDNDVRHMIGEMLSERGYAAELAASANDAIEFLHNDPSFDLVLIDYVMPGINGMALVDKLQAARPGLRTLLMTGHAEMEEDIALPAESIIRKPFNIETLDERIETLLARPSLRAMPGGKAAEA